MKSKFVFENWKITKKRVKKSPCFDFWAWGVVSDLNDAVNNIQQLNHNYKKEVNMQQFDYA